MASSFCFSLHKADLQHLCLNIPGYSHMQGPPSAHLICWGQKGRICPNIQMWLPGLTVVTPQEVMLIERMGWEGSPKDDFLLDKRTTFKLFLFIPQAPELEGDMILYVSGFMSGCKLYRVLNLLCIFGYCRIEAP